MPSLDAPGYYDRASTIADPIYDPFFRLLTPDDSIDDFGTVDNFPLGHVMLVHLDRGSIDAILGEQEHPEMYSVPVRGWYNVRTDERGFIFGIYYGEDSTFNEERARADFNEGLQVWVDWSDENFD